MIYFSRFNSLGQYTAVCLGTEDSLQHEDQATTYIGKVNPNTQYHDVATGLPVGFPTKPSPHHTFDYITKQWVDPRTLDDLKAQQWAAIKKSRSAVEYGGFTWDGSTFDSDQISQARITGAVTLATLSPEFTIDWTTADNTVRTLSQADMVAVGVALGTHVATQFAIGVALRDAIAAATTQADIEAVVWSV